MMRLIALMLLCCSVLQAQKVTEKKDGNYDKKLFAGMQWRSIGPWRAGRCLAVTGVPGNPFVYYEGQEGGGIWKTVDGGINWLPISDSNFKSSAVGALAVAKSNVNVVYAGMGEVEMRSNISFGDGMYKSTDAGKTWKHIGLEKTFAIGTVVVDPRNEDVVYAAALGKIFGTNKERGLYKSIDGGKSWKNMLYINDSTGCVDVKMDPTNPAIIYASMWKSSRNAYSLNSGGEGCALYKSTDGGETWTMISENPGMPLGPKGKIICSVSGVNPNKVWAVVENANAGVYVSNDGGATWAVASKMNDLTQRPWYFSQIFADTKNENVVYVLNVEFWKSTDNGRSWNRVHNHHGDNHDMWINPENNMNWIMGDDGGPEVTFDGGDNFSDVDLPTGQFYHVNLDNDFPFGVYGPQQDIGSVKIKSATSRSSIGSTDFYRVAGGEAGYIVPDPLNPDITYGGEYDGQLSTYNKRTEQHRLVSVFPELHQGEGANVHKYRFNWTMPISFSPHDPKMMYATSNIVHRTTDGGNSWTDISPDLTRHEAKTLLPSGGPISLDNTGAETYATIFAIQESYIKKGLIWTGSDDGLVYVTKNDGGSWTNVTPKGLGTYALISYVEPSHFDEGVCYVTATRYKSDDNKPYIFKTSDYGNTWTPIVTGLPGDMYVRSVREDPERKGLLYAGTETGVYISFNDGMNWESLQLNLPITPVHDIQIQQRDKALVIATHGRGFWILDDITPFYQLNETIANSKTYLFKPRFGYRVKGQQVIDPKMQAGTNAPNGVMVRYYLKDSTTKEVKLKFMTEHGDSIITYSSKKSITGISLEPSKEYHINTKLIAPTTLRQSAGMHNFTWNMEYPEAKGDTSGRFEGTFSGPIAAPGNYKVALMIGDEVVQTQPFEIKRDPRVLYNNGDLQEHFQLSQQIHKKQMEIYETLKQLRSVRQQLKGFTSSFEDTSKLLPYKPIIKIIEDTSLLIENKLYNQKIQAGEDDLRFPMSLGEKLSALKSTVMESESKPTLPMYASFKSLSERIDNWINRWKMLLNTEVSELNSKATVTAKKVIELR
ncbi:MAG: hypothetical protein NVSMB45_10570 [Ginsengibacter sp.]